MRRLLVALLLLIATPAISCTWKWEITLYSGDKTWKEEIIASNRQDAERTAMARNLQSKWLKERPEEIRIQFNLKTVQELHHAPLRTFTGFLQRSDGGKSEFWQKHGQNHVAKMHLETEKTDDHAQRYNLKRRLEEVLGDRRELAIWTNIMLMEGGYP